MRNNDVILGRTPVKGESTQPTSWYLKQLLSKMDGIDVSVSSSSDASSANQIIQNNLLSSIFDELKDEKTFNETIWIDSVTGLFYVRVRTYDADTNTAVITWQDVNGNVVVPPNINNLVQSVQADDLELIQSDYKAIIGGTGYVVGDWICSITIVNTADNSFSVLWRNITTATTIAAPNVIHLQALTDVVITNGTQKTRISNGTNDSAVINSNPVGTEYALVTRNIPNGTQIVVQSGNTQASKSDFYKAIVTGSSYNAGDFIEETTVFEIDTTGVITTTTKSYFNKTQGIVCTPDNLVDFIPYTSTDRIDYTSSLNAHTGLLDSINDNTVAVKDTLLNEVLQVNIVAGGSSGTTNGALETTQTSVLNTLVNKTQSTQITDGTKEIAIKAASTAAISTDNALVVAVSPNNIVNENLATINSTAVSTGSGVNGAGVQRVTIATDQTAVASNITQIGGATVVQGSGVSTSALRVELPTNGTGVVGLNAGTNTIGSINNVSGIITLPTGASTSALQTTGNTALSNIDTKIPTLGQALSSASTPVVLPAAQITTLTPPAAITGFNLEATQLLVKAKTDNLDVALSTRLKPSDTLAGITTVGAVTAITNALPTGANTIGNTNQTLATAEFAKITDGTNTVTVKPASTAPIDTDTSAVVSLHPLGNTITTGATSYFESTQNKTTTNLAAGATFTGTIVSVLNYPQAIISINSDQPFTLTVEQFSDLAGVYQLPSIVYTRLAGEDFNQPITLSGSYVRVKLQNTGASATTNLFLETWFGTISATPNLTNAGSLPVDVKTQSEYIIGQAAQTAVIANILPSTATSVATDAGGYNSGTTTVVSTGTGGTFIFEGSNDNVTFEPLTVKRTTLTNGDILTTSITATASTLTYEYAVKYKT
jgi:hypothetical protein